MLLGGTEDVATYPEQVLQVALEECIEVWASGFRFRSRDLVRACSWCENPTIVGS